MVVLWVLDSTNSPLLAFTIHALVNSAGSTGRSWLVDSLGASLSNRRGRCWIFHSTLLSQPGVDGVNFVLVHTYVFDVLPESIYVSCCVKSLEVGSGCR